MLKKIAGIIILIVYGTNKNTYNIYYAYSVFVALFAVAKSDEEKEKLTISGILSSFN